MEADLCGFAWTWSNPNANEDDFPSPLLATRTILAEAQVPPSTDTDPNCDRRNRANRFTSIAHFCQFEVSQSLSTRRPLA
jgi:hypothetical protein